MNSFITWLLNKFSVARSPLQEIQRKAYALTHGGSTYGSDAKYGKQYDFTIAVSDSPPYNIMPLATFSTNVTLTKSSGNDSLANIKILQYRDGIWQTASSHWNINISPNVSPIDGSSFGVKIKNVQYLPAATYHFKALISTPNVTHEVLFDLNMATYYFSIVADFSVVHDPNSYYYGYTYHDGWYDILLEPGVSASAQDIIINSTIDVGSVVDNITSVTYKLGDSTTGPWSAEYPVDEGLSPPGPIYVTYSNSTGLLAHTNGMMKINIFTNAFKYIVVTITGSSGYVRTLQFIANAA